MSLAKEIPGDVSKNFTTDSEMEKPPEMEKPYNRKFEKKIYIGILILSAVIFFAVICLRYGGILKLSMPNEKLPNLYHRYRNNCVVFLHKTSPAVLDNVSLKICSSNK